MSTTARNIAATSVLVMLMSLCCGCAQQSVNSFSWQQTDDSVALLKDGQIVWRLNHKKNDCHPYFHPLALADGTVLTADAPADHPWHRGLWFSWKYINGVNYWDPVPAKGRTQVTDVDTQLAPDHSARIELSISYRLPDQDPVMTEKRILRVSRPDKSGSYYIDWLSTFKAGNDDLVLDRTPIPGQEKSQPYGGYAGLSLRLADIAKNFDFLSSDGPVKSEKHGTSARWLDFAGETDQGKYAGITILDHPDNLNYPTPWWLSASMPFFSPAIIYHQPYSLDASETLTLRYRILIRTKPKDKGAIEKQWHDFVSFSRD